MKQCIREVKFSKKEKHPLIKKFADTISPFAWGHLEAELKIMKENYNFVLNEVNKLFVIFLNGSNL
jgi:hypothetical protein